MRQQTGIGLALSGGGVRGLAHVGVIKALVDERIPIHFVCGTSVGALIGAAFAACSDVKDFDLRVSEIIRHNDKQFRSLSALSPLLAGPQSEDLYARISQRFWRQLLFNLLFFRKALITLDEAMDFVSLFVPDIDIRETLLPCAITAVDLVSGKRVVLTEGPLIKAVAASSAIPGIMAPVPWRDRLLIDGAVLDPVPAETARCFGKPPVIAVDVYSSPRTQTGLQDGIELLYRTLEVMSLQIAEWQSQGADLLLRPVDDKFSCGEERSIQEWIDCGKIAVQELLGAIKNLLDKPVLGSLPRTAKKFRHDGARRSHRPNFPLSSIQNRSA
ncbi:patatin-like phospholipase family protein [Desulfoferrobacter suflitae]|uniref:patatin-like phospholipase family protein n=1 Tax=Desulfoferrobacter suflitae TaxID=2865782 RepID=UPI002164AD84|nr:patatin-like phospholipase family protein [Desulfoferrobacter suflitae]MCK8603723.1 patatin-like phospholipase family protein [Desulfoferrobacter suflitae]